MIFSPMGYFNGVFGVYKRWCTWPRIITLVVIGTFSGLMGVQKEIADEIIRGTVGLSWQPWVATYSSVIGFTLISPFLIYCCELWPFGKAYVFKTTIKLVLLYLVITFLFITTMLCLRNIAYLIIDGSFYDSGNIFDRYAYEYPKAIGVYLIFAFITYTKIYFDNAQEEKLNAINLQNELQATQMKNLRSQLQPNFLFSTLSLISNTVYTDADKADSIIARLGDLLRYSLATEQKPFVTLKEELQAMQSYLEISQLRFGERMAFEVSVASTTELVLIPTMLLQPLLENSVKHGIEPFDERSKLTLTCDLIDGVLQIKISNTWQHPPQSQQQKALFESGLQSTKDRLTLLYQDQAKVILDNSDTDTVTLTIMLPAQQMGQTEQINE